MARKIIHINPYLKNREARIERIALSAAASARIEGIEPDVTHIRRITEKAVIKFENGRPLAGK